VSPRTSLAGGISSPKSPVGTVQKIGLHGASLIRIPGAALGVPRSSLAGGNCGRAVEYLRRDRSFIPLVRELGGDTGQNFAKWLPSVGSLHGFNHE